MFMRCVGVTVLCLAAGLTARADELGAVALSLCEKVKSCALEQMSAETLTPQERQQMQPVLDNLCVTMQNKAAAVPAGHPLYAPTLACLRSMETLTCAMMQDPDQMVTPACATYEKLARESETAS
jgi:hypothetical protein